MKDQIVAGIVLPRGRSSAFFAIAFFVIMGWSVPLKASVWTNTSGGNWNNPVNWDPNEAPGVSGDYASLSQPVNVILESTVSLSYLSISPGASLTITTNGVLNILGGLGLQGPLDNFGTVNWLGGEVYFDDNYLNGSVGSVWNHASGIWDIECDGLMSHFAWYLHGNGNGAYFTNDGLLKKSAGGGTTSFQPILVNNGTVDIQTGTVECDWGLSLQDGVVQVQPDSHLDLHGYLIGQGTLHGTVTILGAALRSDSSLTIATNGILNIDADTFGIDGPLVNHGTVNWRNGLLSIISELGPYYYYGEIWNETNGVWNVECDQSLYGGRAEVFHNAGLLRKSGTGGTTLLNLAFVNNGTIDLESGVLRFNRDHYNYPGPQSCSLEDGTIIFGVQSLTNVARIEFTDGYTWLSGTAKISLLGGYVPQIGDSFGLFNGKSLLSDFAVWVQPEMANWQTSCDGSNYVVSVTGICPLVNDIPDFQVNPGERVGFQVDVPEIDPGDLTFGLVAGRGSMSPDGHFDWRATAAMAGMTNAVILGVTNSGVPSGFTKKAFNIAVNELLPVTLLPAIQPAGNRNIQVTGSPGLDYILETSSDLSTWIPVATNTSASLPLDFAITNLASSFYRVLLSP